METFYLILSAIFIVAICIGLPLVVMQFNNASKELKKIETNKNPLR